MSIVSTLKMKLLCISLYPLLFLLQFKYCSVSAQDSNQKLANTMLPNIVELTAATLSSAPDDSVLRKTAVLLLSACTLMNRVHREFAFQVRTREHHFLSSFSSVF